MRRGLLIAGPAVAIAAVFSCSEVLSSPVEVSDICELASLQIIDSQTIKVRAPRGGGRCSGFMLGMPNGPLAKDELEIRQGGTFSSFEHHASNDYKFVKIEDGKIVLKHTARFDARSFGDGITTGRPRLLIVPPFERLFGQRSVDLPIMTEDEAKEICKGLKLFEKVNERFPEFRTELQDPHLVFSVRPLVARNNTAMQNLWVWITLETEPSYTGRLREAHLEQILDYAAGVAREFVKSLPQIRSAGK